MQAVARVGRPSRGEPGVKKQFVLNLDSWSQLQRWARAHDCTLSDAICRMIAQATNPQPISPYIAGLRKLTPGERLQAATTLYWSARQLKAAGLSAQHPCWSEERIEEEVRKAFMAAR